MVDIITVAYGVLVAILAGVSAIIIFQVWKKRHPYKLRIRRLTGNNSKVVRDAIGKQKKDKNGVLYLKAWYGIMQKPMPNKLPIPSAEVTDYDVKGNKLIVEAYYDESRGFTYIRDGINVDDLNKLNDVDGFRSYPSYSREMLINELAIANSMKPKTTPEVIMYMTPFIALVMILTVFLIFYGKAVQPINDLNAKQQEYQTNWLQQASEIQDAQSNLFRNIVNSERGQPLETISLPPEAGG